MITVNFREMEWAEDLTVASLLQRIMEEPAFLLILHDNAMVIVNNELVPVPEYAGRKIADGDEIRVYPLIAGG